MFNLKTHLKYLSQIALPLSIVLTLTACGHDDDDEMEVIEPPPVVMEYQYQVTVTNLTNAQPLSPIAVLLHDTGEIWQIGQRASSALENLSESGDNSGVMAEDYVVSSESNGDILMPGTQTDIMIMTTDEAATNLSLATMLVNTNDAFTGLSRVDLSSLAVDEMLTYKVAVYDAGTEANSEAAGSIPGPADGGEGFNMARDDVDYVARHPGAVGVDDGLSSSVLNNEHKFDNPAMSVKIVRVQ
jgi:hypothetical protein